MADTVDRINRPSEQAAEQRPVGNKNAIRRETKNGDIIARMDALKQKFAKLDSIDGQMATLRPLIQDMRMEFLKGIKKTAIRNGDLSREVVGPYSNDIPRTGYRSTLNGNPIFDLQLYLDGVRDDGRGALYEYMYGVPTSEVLEYKGMAYSAT